MLKDNSNDDYKIYLMEGLKIALGFIGDSYENLYPSCCELLNNKGPEQIKSYMKALSYAWVFIDNYRLVLHILKQFPDDLKDNQLLRELNELSQPLINLRNYHYHFDEKYNRYGLGPTFGNLSFVDPTNEKVSYIVIPTILRTKNNSIGLIFDSEKGVYTSRVLLSIDQTSVSFDLYKKELKRYIDIINSRIEKTDNQYQLKLTIIETRYCKQSSIIQTG